jgi:hypothetical protein
MLMVLYAVGRISQSSKTDTPSSPSFPRALIRIKVRSEWAGVKDAGGAGAGPARLALGRREQASRSRDRHDRPRTQDAVIFNGPGRRMGWREQAGGGGVPSAEGFPRQRDTGLGRH